MAIDILNMKKKIATIAKRIGFTQISISHQVSPLMKIIPRGDTTVLDAYFIAST